MNNRLSIKYILDSITRHPLMKNITLEEGIYHTIHFMRIVGSPKIFEDKIVKIKIDNHRGQLPCDFYQINQVRLNDTTYLKHSSDTFHTTRDCGNSYKMQGNVIFTSMKEGEVEVSYQSIPVDEEGYPTIPDNSEFIRALELYIKKHHFTVLFDMGEIKRDVLDRISQEYAWAVGACASDFVRLTLDQADSFFNSLNDIRSNTSHNSNGYANLSSPAQLKVH